MKPIDLENADAKLVAHVIEERMRGWTREEPFAAPAIAILIHQRCGVGYIVPRASLSLPPAACVTCLELARRFAGV